MRDVLTLAGTAEANATVKVYDGATLLGTATANGRGAWSYTTGTLNNGVHSLTATATDAAGNTGAASTAMSVTIETGVPVVTASLANDTGSSSADAITSNATLTGLADPNTVIHFTVDGSAIAQTATADGSGVWSFTPTGLADGAHTIVASQTDVAGNTGTASLSFTLDTAAPIAPTIASFSNDSGVVGDGITNDNTLTLTGTAEANATVKVYDGATLLGTATANGTGAWSYTTGTLNNGAHSLTATATDAAGNTGAASAALSVTVDTVAPGRPTITSFTPDSGTVGDTSPTTTP